MQQLEKEVHFIGQLTQEEMKTKLSVKQIIDYNQKKLKLIEMKNKLTSKQETIADLAKDVIAHKKIHSPKKQKYSGRLVKRINSPD